MNQSHNHILSKGQVLDDKYTMIFFLKKGAYAETYRVKDQEGKPKFLKLFSMSKLHRTQFDQNGDVLEIEILKQLKHPNIVSFNDSGSLIIDNQKYAYVILDYISGETLAEKMKREHALNTYEAKDIILGVLNGLNYLHSQENPIIHNEITNSNVMLDLSGQVPVPKIIDFGYARYLSQSNKEFLKDGLNPFYLSNEALNGVFTLQSDVFSAGALYYHILFGLPPWFFEISPYKDNKNDLEEILVAERNNPLSQIDIGTTIDQLTLAIIKMATEPKTENRFKDTKEFVQALNGELEVVQVKEESKQSNIKNGIKRKTKGGFSAIAGMSDLKEKLKNDVIDLINDPEGAKEYNINMPNGMLLYGPPGCGKTFFAERFAEETGFNFKYVNPSDLASIYIHGAQEKISSLFKEARENAPYIICLDEVSSLFPKRESASSHQIGEVDEFLTQLNNCGEDGIFVIAMTNFPENIDDAVLRAGRIDIKIYVPPPDFEARKALFKLYLDKIPKELGIDYEKLADLTENYVSSDIKLIIESISRLLRKSRQKVTFEHLINQISCTRPSVNMQVLARHQSIKQKFETGNQLLHNELPRIGFKTKRNGTDKL